jgi:Na+-driven multidrug efflux pump
MALAATALVGQATGAKDPASARRAARISANYAAIWMSMIGLVYFALGPQITSFFSNDPAVVSQGGTALRVLAFSQPFWGWMLVYSGSMRGIGNSRYPMMVNSATLWLAVILGFIMIRSFGFGLGVVWSAFILVSPWTILLLRRRLMSDPLMSAADYEPGAIEEPAPEYKPAA